MISGWQNDGTAELKDRFTDGRGLDQVAVKSEGLIAVVLIEETVVTVAAAVRRGTKNNVLGVDADTFSERDIILRARAGSGRTAGIAENRGIGNGVRPLHIRSSAGVVPIRRRQVPVSRAVYWWIDIRLSWIPGHALCVSRCSVKNGNNRCRQTCVTNSLFHVFLSAKTFISDRFANACTAIQLLRRTQTTRCITAVTPMFCHEGYN